MTGSARIDPRAVNKAIANDPQVQKALGDIAEGLAEKIRERSPLGNPRWTRNPGYFKRRTRAHKYRTWWRVDNYDAFAHLVEWGSVNNPPYAPFRNAIETLGLRFDPHPKPEPGDT